MTKATLTIIATTTVMTIRMITLTTIRMITRTTIRMTTVTRTRTRMGIITTRVRSRGRSSRVGQGRGRCFTSTRRVVLRAT
jgi:hypothetical protein